MDILEDFKLHEETITNWVLSCVKEPQLDICRDVINRIFITKFMGEVPTIDLDIALNTFQELISQQERKIKYYPEKPQPNANASPSY